MTNDIDYKLQINCYLCIKFSLMRFDNKFYSSIFICSVLTILKFISQNISSGSIKT